MRTTTKHTLCAWAWVALLPLMAARGNDDDAAREGATVTLAFTTRANAPAAPLAEGEEGPANANESIAEKTRKIQEGGMSCGMETTGRQPTRLRCSNTERPVLPASGIKKGIAWREVAAA